MGELAEINEKFIIIKTEENKYEIEKNNIALAKVIYEWQEDKK